MDFSKKIWILDGAMGTMLQKMSLTGCSELHNINHPEQILRIHREYIEAGADIIETNTFGANQIVQAEHGYADMSRKMAYEGARLARKAADEAGRKVYVAGSVGPTSKSLTIGTDANDGSLRAVSFEEMEHAYRIQVQALIEGGVDMLLIETCFDALNVKAAIRALDGKDIPVIISAAVSDRSSRVLTGQTLEAFYTTVRHCNPLAFGLNCSLGAEQMKPLVREISSFACCALSCYPNAGLPDELGRYTQTPEEMASSMRSMAEDGLINIAGGCCGTTPGHIKAIRDALKDIPPRTIPAAEKRLHVAGLEDYAIDLGKNNLTNIGERTNVAGSRKFARLISEGDYAQAVQIAASQVENGARIIDINMDDAMLDSAYQMEKFVKLCAGEPDVAKAAFMIDSSDWNTVLAGLKYSPGKCIVNSISLKEGEEVFIRKALEIKSYGGAMVVMAFDENSQATTLKRKIEVCSRSYNLLTRAGIAPCDIIFDVNVLSVGTGVDTDRRYAIDFIEAVRWIKANLPGALTSGGISNLSFAFRGNNAVREAMHSVFLYHAVNAGLDMAIVNPGMLQVYDDINPELLRAVEDVILDSDAGASARLLEKASGNVSEKQEEARQEDNSAKSVDDRLIAGIIKGNPAGMEQTLGQALQLFPDASSIIEGPLMKGMETVGEMFSCGKMFLPQVVKSARIMKLAVDYLQPYIESGSRIDSGGPVAVIATVKGDVHDIGKNITATVLRCNGFNVHDLGVMVERDVILGEAERLGAAIIAVSGLITPSLAQMEDLCREMSSRGLDTPLLIGGATTSALHTAVKLAPLYPHVFHGSDASASAVIAKKLMLDRVSFEEAEHRKQEELRNMHTNATQKTATAVPGGKGLPFSQSPEGLICQRLDASEIAALLDWKTFFAICWIKAKDYAFSQALEARSDAAALLERMISDGQLDIRAGYSFRKASSDGQTITLQNGTIQAPIASYISEDGVLGAFAASVRCPECSCCGNEYDSLLRKTLCLTLADAVSEWIGSRIDVPQGYRLIRPAIGYRSCPDHSLKRDVLNMLDNPEVLGISLTESFAMIPLASVCGFLVINTEAGYL